MPKSGWKQTPAVCLFTFVLAAVRACAAGLQPPAAKPQTLTQPSVWVEQTLKSMTVEEKVGQMLQIRVYGDYGSFTSPEFLFVKDEIERYHIGSVDLGARMLGPNLVKGSPAQSPHGR